MNWDPKKNRLHFLTISFVSRFLAVFIFSSFAITLLPIANTSAESSMPCCAGKSEGHCDSGLLAPKPRFVPKEPMCGLHSAPKANAVKTVVTDPISVESVSDEQECPMNCGACATATSRLKRQKSLMQARTPHYAPSTVAIVFDSTPSFYSSNRNWTRINPRGPPSVI